MTGFTAPPQQDFHSYANLTTKQGGHLDTLVQWSGSQCADTGGLDGLLLLPLLEIVPSVSHFFSGKLSQCRRGMDVIADKVRRTSDAYTSTDRATAADLRGIYPHSYANFPAVAEIPGASHLGDFTDEDVTLKEPTSAEDDTAKNIHHQLLALGRNSELKGADKLFQFCTGQSLVELLLTPLVGEYGRLRYLHDAYDALGDAAYTVAGTLRKGSWKLGGEWKGDTGTAFDEYLFRWTMGIGGVGDAAKIAAKAYLDGYEAIVGLVYAALREIDELIKNEIKQLAEEAAKMAAGDAAIEAVGLGPEDPLADVGAGIYTAYRMYKIYKIVRTIVSIIMTIEKIFEAISKAVDTIRSDVQKVADFISSPSSLPSVGSLVDDVEQRGFEFEKGGGWSPAVGASRIAMLPAA